RMWNKMKQITVFTISAISALVYTRGVGVACDAPPTLRERSHFAKFSGQYSNEGWEYSVGIPVNRIGYDPSGPGLAPHHGFEIFLDPAPATKITVWGEANSDGAETAAEAAVALLSYTYGHGENYHLESASIAQARLGQLNAMRMVAKYT